MALLQVTGLVQETISHNQRFQFERFLDALRTVSHAWCNFLPVYVNAVMFGTLKDDSLWINILTPKNCLKGHWTIF